MDFNLTVLCGHLAAPPEIRSFESGSRLIRYLLTVRSERPRRRVDVLPVTLWDPSDDMTGLSTGSRLWVVGTVQRRFWDGAQGRRSRLEIIAEQVAVRPDSPPCLEHSAPGRLGNMDGEGVTTEAFHRVPGGDDERL